MPRKAAAPRKATPAVRKAVPRKAAAPRKTVAKKTAAPARRAPAKKTTAPRTAAKAGLRVVKPGETQPQKPNLPPTITEAAEAGDERALLVALRKKLAQTIQDSSTPARDQASLSIRLLQINRDIQAIDARAKEESEDGGEVEDETFDPEAL